MKTIPNTCWNAIDLYATLINCTWDDVSCGWYSENRENLLSIWKIKVFISDRLWVIVTRTVNNACVKRSKTRINYRVRGWLGIIQLFREINAIIFIIIDIIMYSVHDKVRILLLLFYCRGARKRDLFSC